MASKTRKVSFYRLSLEKSVFIEGSHTVQKSQLTNNEIEEKFREIYDDKMQRLSNGNHAKNINVSSSQYV